MKKEDKMIINILIFIYTVDFVYLKVYTKFLTQPQIGADKSVTDKSIGEKDK